MKNRILGYLLGVVLLIALAGCSSEVAMPYGSRDYATDVWTVSEMKEHFKDLGFSEIYTIERDTYDTSLAEHYVISIRDDSESEDAEYREYEADEKFDRSSRVSIVKYSLIMTADNSPEFKELLEMDHESSEWTEKWKVFIESHIGDCIEFDGLITRWYDEFWYISGVDFIVSVEGSMNWELFGGGASLKDLGTTGEYSYNKYKLGLIKEGDHARVRIRIERKDQNIVLDYESFEIIK